MSEAFTDADYERVVRERDEALARVDSQRSQIAFYRTACTARFLPEGFGDETMRELIKELAEERDEARAQVDELRGQYQYSVGLSMALEERDQARRERDQEREACAMYAERSGRFAEQADKLKADLEDARSIIEDLNDEITRGREAIRIYRTETEAAKRERDEARREADRFRHGCTVEGDFVCPNEYAVSELTAERNFLRALKKNHEEDFSRVCKERDEARANYQWMVNRACDEKLDGYRELGAKCAQLEEERDEAREAYRDARASRWHVSKKWDEALKEIERLRTENEDMGRALNEARAEVDAAYLERNQLVALLSKVFPAGLKRTEIPGWSPEWHGCVFVDFPWGQASWHYHERDAALFAHLGPYTGKWDGHTTEEKYKAIAAAQVASYADLRAEVERLRAEAASSLAMAKIADAKHDQKCAEVDMLRGVGCMEDGDGPCGVCRKCAYRRGAEAMREACARWMSEREGISQWVYDDALSALPIPEET